jgi:hypothetical protein
MKGIRMSVIGTMAFRIPANMSCQNSPTASLAPVIEYNVVKVLKIV